MKSDIENRSLIKIIKPLELVFILFTYLLGVSVAHYLGGRINLVDLLIGFIICLLMWSMRFYLGAYFDHPESYYCTLNRNDPEWEDLINVRRSLLLLYSLLILTAGATLTTILIFRGVLNPSAIMLLGIAVILNFFAGVPPLRLARNGYSELVDALFIANLVPAIAFSQVKATPSVLIIELTLPLTFIYLAFKIAMEFKTYGFDESHGRKSLVTRVGWQRALVMHNTFIILAFLLLGLFLLFGLPWSLVWPPMLTLPIGILQVLHLQRIADGVKPNWQYLTWLSLGVLFLMIYMEIISLWL